MLTCKKDSLADSTREAGITSSSKLQATRCVNHISFHQMAACGAFKMEVWLVILSMGMYEMLHNRQWTRLMHLIR